MEVGPTCHYVMGGVEVEPGHGDVEGAGPVRGRRGRRRHARLQPARRQLAVRPAGVRPPGRRRAPRRTSTGSAGVRPAVARSTTSRRPQERALLPFSSATEGGENPFVVQLELQKTMNDLVGIIRKADEMEQALKALRGPRGAHPHGQRRGRTGSSTRAGTSRWTCATCCWSRCAWPRRRWSGRRAAAGTPATTTRRWTPTGGTCCWCCPRWARTTSSWCARSRCRCGPTCSTCSSSTS